MTKKNNASKSPSPSSPVAQDVIVDGAQDKAPPVASKLSDDERAAAIAETLDALGATTDRNAQKGLRAKLRRLGHVGGLRATKVDDSPADAPKVKKSKAPKGDKGAPVADEAIVVPHPLSNTKAAKAARKALAKQGK